MIDLTINAGAQARNAAYCRQRGIKLPTFAMMKDPDRIPAEVKEKLKNVGLWDINPLNIYRITWKNAPQEHGGQFGGVNYLRLPSALTGVKANIIALTGKWFPTGAHKVGATFGCLAPRLATGQFEPEKHRAVWPSTGNFCRGGAYVSSLLGCSSIAILPEGMSRERFEWLKKVAGEVIATHGCESNVKEIFDKCWELRKTRDNIFIFNQFEELGNPLWHYNVTGSAMEEVLTQIMGKGDRLAGGIYSSGSAGTLASGYYLKSRYPGAKVAAAEALQCPTLLQNGFGDHRIEGIGDKHIPWIHDAKDIDMNIAVDDENAIRMLRLFHEERGRHALAESGVDPSFLNKLGLIGISGIGNLIAAIKFAKYYELTQKDFVVTVFTDSMQLYGSRLAELAAERGPYDDRQAWRDIELVQSIAADHLKELTYQDKKSVHNLKYFTWVEQQQRDVAELNRQWYDHDAYWHGSFARVTELDEIIIDFNRRIDAGG